MFSSIDEQGRYAYANQPRIALWNLTRLAECLLPLFSDDQDKADRGGAGRRSAASPRSSTPPIRRACAQDSACSRRATATEALAQDLLDAMAKNQADFTLTFRRLSDAALDPDHDGEVRQLFADPAAYDEWAARWRQRTRRRAAGSPSSGGRRCARSIRPSFRSNHRVEAVIEAAVNRDDFAPFEELLTVLSKPYEDQPAFAAYAEPPEPHQRVLQTFCGT